MATPEQRAQLKNSKPVPPTRPYKPLYTTQRSRSISDDLDLLSTHHFSPERTPAANETVTEVNSTSSKPDVAVLRKMFDKSQTPRPTSITSRGKRPSISARGTTPIPVAHVNSSEAPAVMSSTHSPGSRVIVVKKTKNVSTTMTRTVFVKAPKCQPNRSSSPPPSPVRFPAELTSKASLRDFLRRISLTNTNNNSIQTVEHLTEEDNDTSSRPISASSLVISETDLRDRTTSYSAARDFFQQQGNHHFYQVTSPTSPTPPPQPQPPRRSASPRLHEPKRPPPPRPPPRPVNYLKSQSSGRHSVSFDKPDNSVDDSSHSSNRDLSRNDSSEGSFTDEEEDFDSQRRMKLQKTFEEVHTTEKTYVDILYVLSVKLITEVKNTCDKDDNLVLTFNNTYRSLLGTVQQIYKLHHEHILPQMEEFFTGQQSGNMWSVLEKNYKVIEVLYKAYYLSYYESQAKLDELCKTHALLNEAMLKTQVHLGNLYPITQLNCPNQRLLRYILCMKTCLKHLDVNSSEFNHTRSIHDELDRIAIRCEEQLVISPTQLNELKERLENKFECIKDQRTLIWHGPLKKQSPRKHADIAPRYVIIFSDIILVCSEESGKKLEIKRELSMNGITIDVVHGGRTSLTASMILANGSDQLTSSTVYFPFRVNAVEKSYEFLAEREQDRQIWVRKIREASEAFNKRISTIEIRHSKSGSDEQQLGIRAPPWINDTDVTRCQNCHNRFPPSLILSRRHHCRSCGHCVCGSCSSKKLHLEYCKNEGEMRVCDTCYTHFTGQIVSKNSSIWPKPTRDLDQTILFGDFRLVHSGTIGWIALQEDFQLHVYGAKLDRAEDYSIKLCDLIELSFEAETRTFTMKETSKTHTFAIDANHQITLPKNEQIDQRLKNAENKLTLYAELWHEAFELARSTTLPIWYTRKRDSSDSGVSIVS